MALTWFDVAVPDGSSRPESAFSLLQRVDVLLAALALTALGAAALPARRPSVLARLAIAAAATLIAARELVDQQGAPGQHELAIGGFLAIAGAAAIGMGAVLDRRGFTDSELVRRWALALVPVGFLVPIAWSLASAVHGLVGTTEPDLGGWASTVLSDARAVYLGEPIYQDPDDGHTGQLYTPLHAILVGLLHHVVFWGGWAPLVSILASVAAAAGVGAVAYRRRGPGRAERALALAEAAGIAALAWWLMNALAWSMIFTGHTDQLAWAFAIPALALAPAVAAGSRPASIAAVVLLTAAFWTKQPTAVASVAVLVWLAAMAIGGAVAWRRVTAFAAALAAVNLVVLGLANLVTRGWEFYFNFLVTFERPTSPTFRNDRAAWLDGVWVEFKSAIGLTVLLAAGLWAIVAFAAARRPAPTGGLLRRFTGAPREVHLALLAALLVIFALPLYVSARRQDGTFDNHLIGVTWALALAAAAGYRLAGARRLAGTLAGGFVAGTLVLTAWPAGRDALGERGIRVPEIRASVTWKEVPPELVEYADDHLVWHPAWSSLNAEHQGVVFPNQNGAGDLLSMGEPPGYLEDALLERRFDAVGPINWIPPETDNPYFSGNGRYEENYWRKLQTAIVAKYDPERPVAGGALWERRAGPDRAVWMNRCFGPFEVAGAEWRINKGGGFWCHPGAATLALRQTDAPYSDIRTDEPVRPAGELTVRNAHGPALIAFEPDDAERVSLHFEPAAVELRTGPAGSERTVRRLVLSGGGPVSVRLGPGARPGVSAAGPRAVRLELPGGRSGVLRLGATQGSAAQFELSGLELDS